MERTCNLESPGKKQKHGHGPTLNLEEVEDTTKEATIEKGKEQVEGPQRRRFIKAKKTTQGESSKAKGVRGRTRGLFENANLTEVSIGQADDWT
ncbi:hypothetical protein Pyn_18498 [Prunus yedoensis var. nudiflora]|uniref:Uncharacterized protein n=1 Tax=Prunus yedoensis var. nudiflora TaxID=2094558 RepID=A0A314Y5W0_PRUYE|nr:hypothetical protein Pyn_18498 [Prunus yedoensis var. nudiflora]